MLLLENEIPMDVLYTGAVDKDNNRISIAQMDSNQFQAALRAKGETPVCVGGKYPVGPLRRQLAPHYLGDFARTATADNFPQSEKLKQLGSVCELTRDLARGDFSRIGKEGVFSNFKEELEPLTLSPSLARDLRHLEEMFVR